MDEAELSARSYLESMSLPYKDREPYILHLPPGYHAQFDPDVLVLRRDDGSRVAFFSIRGFVVEIVEQAAWEDYGGEPGELSTSRDSSNCHPPRSHPRVRPWRPRPPA